MKKVYIFHSNADQSVRCLVEQKTIILSMCWRKCTTCADDDDGHHHLFPFVHISSQQSFGQSILLSHSSGGQQNTENGRCVNQKRVLNAFLWPVLVESFDFILPLSRSIINFVRRVPDRHLCARSVNNTVKAK